MYRLLPIRRWLSLEYKREVLLRQKNAARTVPQNLVASVRCLGCELFDVSRGQRNDPHAVGAGGDVLRGAPRAGYERNLISALDFTRRNALNAPANRPQL
jgi:hypothetical protein